MTTDMGPPLPRIPSIAAVAEPVATESANGDSAVTSISVSPKSFDTELGSNHQEENELNSITAASKNSAPSPAPNSSDSDSRTSADVERDQHNKVNPAVPYTIPTWSGPPCHRFFLEVLKDGAIINQFDVNEKGAYMFGRVDLCDFVLEHPTISRFHAVLQFKSNGEAYIYDLGSTHGTFVNKKQVKTKIFVDLHVGDVIRFGNSSRLYIFQGPSELMLPEADMKILRNAKLRLEMQDMESSLLRAKVEASRADGISWGMGEDAIEDNEDECDEITWQTYKGILTEKQDKTREKVIKRLEKISHMKKEINAIRAKDIAQGGLTQGQQTQIARNEQRMSQITEELENLEETLNDSIRESMGAKAGKQVGGKNKGSVDDCEGEYFSDDDDFYDRTQKRSKRVIGEDQSVETADSLLDKKYALINKIEDKKKLLLEEEQTKKSDEVADAGDELDAYMSTVSSQLVLDTTDKLRKELSALESELDRILYLLKISDPLGEAAKRRESMSDKPQINVEHIPVPEASKCSVDEDKKQSPEESSNESVQTKAIDVASGSGKGPEEQVTTNDQSVSSTPAYTVTKPQWLGAVVEKKQEIEQEAPVDMQEQEQFVDYKDRGTVLKQQDTAQTTTLEDASPGLIIRKRKHIEMSKNKDVIESEPSKESKHQVDDAVALLLKHSRGYHASDEDEKPMENRGKGGVRTERVMGPERPTFLEEESDSDWVPPEGQSGDGRTTLNDRFGY